MITAALELKRGLLSGGMALIKHMGSQRTKAMKKLAKLKQMEDVYHKQKDLMKIRKKKESKKAL